MGRRSHLWRDGGNAAVINNSLCDDFASKFLSRALAVLWGPHVASVAVVATKRMREASWFSLLLLTFKFTAMSIIKSCRAKPGSGLYSRFARTE